MATKRLDDVDVREAPISELDQLGQISIAFEVSRILDVDVPGDGLRGLSLAAKPVATPYVIDHDARWGPPTKWRERFDVSKWGLLFAEVAGTTVGSALIACDTPNVFMLEGRRDLASLWDLRVHPDHRGRGVGRCLIEGSETWARRADCISMKIETQNVNVRACELYVRCGYVLRSMDRFAYEDAPEETQLIFMKELIT